MRSQKKNNRTPRPFKGPGADRSWSGGKRTDGLQLHSGFMVRPKKAADTNAAPVDKPAAPAEKEDTED